MLIRFALSNIKKILELEMVFNVHTRSKLLQYTFVPAASSETRTRTHTYTHIMRGGETG